MKSKFLIILLGLVLVLGSCTNLTNEDFYRSVREAYPKAIILTPKYGSNFHFIVIDTISKPNVYLSVSTGNTDNTTITRVTVLYPQN